MIKGHSTLSALDKHVLSVQKAVRNERKIMQMIKSSGQAKNEVYRERLRLQMELTKKLMNY